MHFAGCGGLSRVRVGAVITPVRGAGWGGCLMLAACYSQPAPAAEPGRPLPSTVEPKNASSGRPTRPVSGHRCQCARTPMWRLRRNSTGTKNCKIRNCKRQIILLPRRDQARPGGAADPAQQHVHAHRKAARPGGEAGPPTPHAHVRQRQ